MAANKSTQLHNEVYNMLKAAKLLTETNQDKIKSLSIGEFNTLTHSNIKIFKENNLLTEETFDLIVALEDFHANRSASNAIDVLNESKLLTENNVQSIVRYKRTKSKDQLRKFFCGINDLDKYGLLTQENFDLIRNCETVFPEHIAKGFHRLKELGLLNHKNKLLITNSFLSRSLSIVKSLDILRGIKKITQTDIEFIASHYKPEDFAQVLRTLNNLHLLTESNKDFFKENSSKIDSVNRALDKIYQNNVYENKKLKLTQADFNVIKDHSKPTDVAQALIILNCQGILTDESREAIKDHNDPIHIARALAQLNSAQLSPKNIKAIKEQLNTVNYYHLSRALSCMKKAGLLTQDNFDQLLAQTTLCNAHDFWDRLQPHLLTQMTFEKFIELAKNNPIDTIKEYVDQLLNNKNVNVSVSKSAQRVITPSAPPAELAQRVITPSAPPAELAQRVITPSAPPAELAQRVITPSAPPAELAQRVITPSAPPAELAQRVINPSAPSAEPVQRVAPTAPPSCESPAMPDAPPPTYAEALALEALQIDEPPPPSYQSVELDTKLQDLHKIQSTYKERYTALNHVITAISNNDTASNLANEIKEVLKVVNQTEQEIRPNAINIANQKQQQKALNQYDELVKVLALITDLLEKPENTQLANHSEIINKIKSKQCHTSVGERILSVLANAPILGDIIKLMGINRRNVTQNVASLSLFKNLQHGNNTNPLEISCQA